MNNNLLLEMVENVLTGTKGLKVNEIFDKLVEKNSRIFSGKFLSQLNNALAANVKKRDARFSKIKNGKGGYKKGVYRLKQRRQKRLPSLKEQQKTATLFTGRAGEHAVLSELLFLGAQRLHNDC